MAALYTRQDKIEQLFSETNQELQTLLESLPDNLTLVNQEGTILFANHKTLYNLPDNLVGTRIYDHLSPAYQESARKSIESVFQTGSSLTYEISEGTSKGDLVWFSNHVKPFKSRGRIVNAIIIITTNITRQKRVEDALRQSENQLRETQRLASIAQLAAGVGHEINKPSGCYPGLCRGAA